MVSEDDFKPYEAIPHTNTEINAYFHCTPIVKKLSILLKVHVHQFDKSFDMISWGMVTIRTLIKAIVHKIIFK